MAPTRPKTKEDQVDQLQVTVRDPDEAEVYKRALHRAAIDPKFADTLPPPPVGAEEEHEVPGEENAEQEQEASGERESSVHNQPTGEEADEE